ncbi:MAG: Sec-independent protein translocase protein TatB [Candidatus Competibacter sp.]|nr:Sec-independent protein translocase protein TatB [Candidatus Competibacter sp.]MDG4583137.1 Sec-independent protein translocase protein TatB [Candidatus Competibacter sp.]
MFEIGFWELALIGVVAMIVVGPERLPGLARTAGLWLGKARRMLADLKAEVDRELQLDELKQSLRQQSDLSGIKELANRVQSLRHEIREELEDDPGPPPGWRPGAAPAPPPPGWTPPVSGLESATSATEPVPVRLEKPATAPAHPQKPTHQPIDPPAESTPPPNPSAAN